MQDLQINVSRLEKSTKKLKFLLNSPTSFMNSHKRIFHFFFISIKFFFVMRFYRRNHKEENWNWAFFRLIFIFNFFILFYFLPFHLFYWQKNENKEKKTFSFFSEEKASRKKKLCLIYDKLALSFYCHRVNNFFFSELFLYFYIFCVGK